MRFVRKLNTYESLFRDHVSKKVFRALLRRFGIDCIVLRKVVPESASQDLPVTNASNISQATFNVFGDFSKVSTGKKHFLDKDPTVNSKFDTRILICTIPTDPFDAAASGMLEKQVLYTVDDIQTNDIIVIKCEDKTKKRMIVGQPLQVGLTTPVYKKFEVNNFGGTGTGEL
jgi:hypothetical protein